MREREDSRVTTKGFVLSSSVNTMTEGRKEIGRGTGLD